MAKITSHHPSINKIYFHVSSRPYPSLSVFYTFFTLTNSYSSDDCWQLLNAKEVRRQLRDQLKTIEWSKTRRSLKLFLDGVEQVKRVLLKYLELRPVGVSLAFENDDTWKSRSYAEIRTKYQTRILNCWKNKCSSYEGIFLNFYEKN